MIKPVNMFWNASHMRSSLEYVLECCKKVCSGVCLSRYIFYFATVGQFLYMFLYMFNLYNCLDKKDMIHLYIAC